MINLKLITLKLDALLFISCSNLLPLQKNCILIHVNTRY